MKKRFIYSGILLAGICLWGACSEVGLDTYQPDQNSVYFGMLNGKRSEKNVFVDTTRFSFGDYENTPDTVIYIRVNALGGVSTVDRTFEYEVVDSLTTAIEGVFYTLPEEACVVPANQTFGLIPVHIYYSTQMKASPMYYLVLQLKPNEYFNLDLKLEYVDKTNKQYVQLTRHWVGMSSRIQKPAKWFQVEQYFLDFSSDKYKLINQLCKLNKTDWDNMAFYIAEAYWVAVRNYLQEQINAGTPVMEENDRTGKKQIMKVKGLTGVD